MSQALAPVRSSSDRNAILIQTRRLKMARSAHAYVRGSTRQFYDWLASTPAEIPIGPSVWICGDCHLGNLGPLADSEGRVAIQVRDLDQTVIGNPAHDLIRLGLSLASAARGSNLPGVVTARMLEGLMAGYQDGIRSRSDGPEQSRSKGVIDGLLRRSVRRRWPELARERLEAAGSRIPLGKRFWPLDRPEHAALAALFERVETGVLLTHHRHRAEKGPISLVDAAYWMKGCSSLGRVRYAALIRIGSGKHAPLGLIDIKAAVKAAAPRSADAEMPQDYAERVVAGARALSPNLGERMAAARLDDQPVTLRELAPQDLKIELNRTTSGEAMVLARYLGEVVGRAHGRQMALKVAESWSATLNRDAGRSLDAPTWLWSSVVELLGLHEAAYLEHCRQYALSEAA